LSLIIWFSYFIWINLSYKKVFMSMTEPILWNHLLFLWYFSHGLHLIFISFIRVVVVHYFFLCLQAIIQDWSIEKIQILNRQMITAYTSLKNAMKTCLLILLLYSCSWPLIYCKKRRKIFLSWSLKISYLSYSLLHSKSA
jgi:hypothetical protein